MVETNLPVLILRDIVLFPYSEIRVEANKNSDKLVIESAINNKDGHILIVNSTDPLEESPSIKDLPNIGVIARIKSCIELSSSSLRVVVVGLSRVEILNYLENDNNYLESFVIPTPDYDYNEVEAMALKRVLYKELNNYINASSMMSNSVLGRIKDVDNISKLTDIILSELPFDYSKKLEYLKVVNSMQRIRMIIEDLDKEIETVKLENEIELSLREKIDSSQREYLLREKVRMIREELGDYSVKDTEIDDLRKKIDEGDYPPRVRKRLMEELFRYQIAGDASPEVSIVRNYIDWLIALPWNKSSHEDIKIAKISNYLDDTHYGLIDVKERIIEFVSVMRHVDNVNSPIICLVGPPGTGKTSLARAVAKALSREFVKISVGGVSDEAEIIGHRRTYLGANPGRIITGMKKAGVNNPVFLIDEVDKMTSDYHGSPQSALLSVLDKEQNKNFSDNYIEEEFDLSHVLFILTANDEALIPSALRDRLEIIEINSYTNYDKREIARKYLIPKLFREYKIRDYNISINNRAIDKIITDYTKESGARELSRMIEKICRKVITNDIKDIIIKPNNLKDFLGPIKYYHTKNDKNNSCGVVNALAYTIYGGEILKISSAIYKGNGKIKITGSVGKVMQESAAVSLSYIKNNADNFGIDYRLFKNNDIHIHIEEGATPKDGPSAGVSITTTLISLLSNKVIPNDISMTGEITLRGKVLKIGGLKEKLIAASVNNIKKVFIPVDNQVDLGMIPSDIKKEIEIIPVRDYLEIYYYLFNSDKK